MLDSNKLRELLHKLFPEAKDRSSSTEVAINCPLCKAEGNPDRNNHMYISLGLDGKPPMFHCFKHNDHYGLLTKSFLEQYAETNEYSDKETLENLEFDKNKATGSSFKAQIRNRNYRVFNPVEQTTKENELKRNYINSRLGLNLSYKELISNNIVLNLGTILRVNKLKPTRHEMILKSIHDLFIGFLTNNHSTLICRNLLPKTKFDILHESLQSRYIKYKLFQSDTTGYYILPSQCNLLQHINIRIAEGPFDILSVCYNLNENKRVNEIYAAIGGNKYLDLIEYFLTEFGLVDIEFHIYIDNDIKPGTLERIKYLVGDIIPIFIHANAFPNEKDFGVPMSNIKEYVYKL